APARRRCLAPGAALWALRQLRAALRQRARNDDQQPLQRLAYGRRLARPLNHDPIRSNHFLVIPAKAGIQDRGASLTPGLPLSRERQRKRYGRSWIAPLV